MQTPYLIKRTITCFAFVLVSGFLLSILLSQQACKQGPEKDNKVYKNVTAKEISDALAKSKTNKVILNIYPVKLSDDPQKNDFDIALVYQDASDPGINLGSIVDIKTFENKSANFVNYLKTKKTPQDKVAWGYYIELDSTSVQESKGLSISVLAEKNQVAWCNIRYTKTTVPTDTAIGKCPPQCCTSYTTFSDSTIGRCPPMCPAGELYMGKIMKMVIIKVYRDK